MNEHIWELERLNFAVEAAGIALWSWNVDTDQISLDGRAFYLWGIPRQPVVTFEDLSRKIHPEDLDKVRASFAATRKRLGDYETDFRLLLGKEIRWISARGKGEDQGIVGRVMYGVFIDVTVRKTAEEAREMITGEMHHRVKNLFALASALASISSRSTSSKEEMAADLQQRLRALSDAHAMIRPNAEDQSPARELSELLLVLLKPYLNEKMNSDRVAITVPPLLIGERSATAIALVIHELATNSVKYGALSVPTGSLSISGAVEGADVLVTWRERGGPGLSQVPQTGGFGQKLVNATIEGQLGGKMIVDWLPEGIVARLRLNRVLVGA